MKVNQSTSQLKALYEPRPILVEVDGQGLPTAVTASELQPVERVQDRWKIDDEWWRPHSLSRVYWSLILQDGA